MGVSSTARLPSLGAQSIPPLFSHLQHTSNAKVVARWSITIRSFRAVPVPVNAWPSDSNHPSSTDDPAFTSNRTNAAGSASGSASSASGAPPLTKPRTMWQVWLSDHPGVVFVIVEDTGRSSRAKVWRDWQVALKKWKKAKRAEIEAIKQRDAQKHDSTPVSKDPADPSSDANATEATAAIPTFQDGSQPMDVDVLKVDDAAAAGTVEAEGDEAIPSAGPRPKLCVPSHTRYTVSALTSSMSAMLTGLNLPPPHGAPVGTAGPGAWVPRGAAVSIEGLVLELNSQSLNALPSLSPALASLDTGSADAGVDWRVRVGSVMGGGGRSAGAVVDAEFIPPSAVLPTSQFMHDFLLALFPPGLVPLPAAPMAKNGAPGVQAQGTNATAAGLSYTIGGGTVATAPNRNLNIPVVSDQLWEEIVPRSGESWSRRIAKRSNHMRAAKRKQRRPKAAAPKPPAPADDAFGWHTLGGDDTAEEGDGEGWDEEAVSSESEAETGLGDGMEGTGMAGTAVTMQQVDDDDDDDDDRPLGAPAWTQPKASTASAADVAPTPNVARKEDTVQLIFQGLRPDADEPSEGGVEAWDGIERGRRIAFQYVHMLRAEGII